MSHTHVHRQDNKLPCGQDKGLSCGENTACEEDMSCDENTAGGEVSEAKSTAWIIPAVMVSIVMFLMIFTSLNGPVVRLSGTFEAWASITVAVVLQALPFLVLGVIVSGVISAFIPENLLRKYTPRNEFLSVPTAATAGFFLPGCECASVPVAQSLIRRKVPAAAALTFLLASPAINPVVLVSTAVAFQGQPLMVLARLVASALAAIIVGWLWVIFGGKIPMGGDHMHSHAGANKWDMFRASALHDLMNAGGFLALGAMAAALIKVTVPGSWFATLNEHPFLACLVMAALAVALSLCSEADAFIAASFTLVSPTAQLVFLVVGPMVDFKLLAMQYGAWGRKFLVRFAPTVLVSAVASGIAIGAVLFGGL